MGSFANSLFKIMLGWLQGVVAAVWSAFTSENGSALFNWIGRNWIVIAAVLCVTGLAADLCVYILRWKPFRVWKSFFTRGKDIGDEPAAPKTGSYRNAYAPEPYSGEQSLREQLPREERQSSDRNSRENLQAPDLSHWEQEETPPPKKDPDQKPATVTGAGYVVPADSPYRRPAREETGKSIQAPEPAGSFPGRTEREGSTVVSSRRRRRISVSELFSDPEEELRQFDAQQHVIDSRKAYRDPVYPRGWNKSEDNGE